MTSESFILAPSLDEKVLASCELSLVNISKAISCVSPEIDIAPQLCQNTNEDCSNLIINTTPATYIPSLAPVKNCGYRWRGFNVKKFRVQVQNWKEKETLICSESMCTSATFLALISQAKSKMESGDISQQEFDDISTVGADAYKMLNSAAEPNELVERFGLGTGHIIHIADTNLDESPIPTKGDIVQFWRKNGSGHSVVFKGFLDTDNDGVSDKICYWSSQKRTDGFGNSCEDINEVNRLLIGHLE